MCTGLLTQVPAFLYYGYVNIRQYTYVVNAADAPDKPGPQHLEIARHLNNYNNVQSMGLVSREMHEATRPRMRALNTARRVGIKWRVRASHAEEAMDEILKLTAAQSPRELKRLRRDMDWRAHEPIYKKFGTNLRAFLDYDSNYSFAELRFRGGGVVLHFSNNPTEPVKVFPYLCNMYSRGLITELERVVRQRTAFMITNAARKNAHMALRTPTLETISCTNIRR
jgi:hypothetical protein